MPKYFVNRETLRGETVSLLGETAHHLARVLRIRPGEKIILCDGEGMDYTGVVKKVTASPPAVDLAITGSAVCENEPAVKITLYQGIPKGDKLGWVVQKCVELGIFAVVPVFTAHTEVQRFNAEKIVRLQKIATAAAEQSMRGIIPKIHSPISFAEMLDKTAGHTLLLAAYEKERAQSVGKALAGRVSGHAWLASAAKEKEMYAPAPHLGIFIGPEGGLSESEAAQLYAAEKNGTVRVISLGPRVLRTETAGLCALILTLYTLENNA